MPSSPARWPFLWLIFCASLLVGVGLFFIPAFVIRPFSHQSPAALSLAMALHQLAPWATLATALISLIVAQALWRVAGRWRKAVLVLGVVLAAFSAVMARANYFEWMFHPVDSPQFEAEADSRLASSEMVLAVRFGADARAYPIREMAYHHILNDVVEGVPVAVTY
jgi:hypothetical protein